MGIPYDVRHICICFRDIACVWYGTNMECQE